MGLRCSLFGHAYGEPVTERDRKRRGDEEVVTVRELRTCKRCGVEKVLSENTEVRHLDSVPADPDPGSPVDREAATEANDDRSAPESTEEEVDVADLVDAAEADRSTPAGAADSADATAESGADTVPESEDDAKPAAPEADEGAVESDEPVDDEDGGIIMDEGPDDDESGTGASETAESPAEADPGRNVPSEAEPERSEPSEVGKDEQSPADEEPTADAADDKSDGVVLGADSGAVGPDTEDSKTPEEPEDALSGDDALDDIDDIEADAEEPGDATAFTAEPESMFGAGAESDPGSDHASGAEASAPGERDAGQSDTTADDWKEPLEEDVDSTTGDWDDPAYQFQPEPEESDAPETGPRRGPAGIASEGPLETDSGSDTKPGALVCPDCGYTETAQSSLRAGDICPECHRGYLAGRQ